MKKTSTKTNLQIAYILSFISELYIPIAIWLFFLTKYLNFKEIALISSLGYVASIIFEVPTGAFADIVGRKISIVISYFIFAVTMLLFGFSHTFVAFFVLTIIGALGDALYSGSLDALVYDTLKENGEENQYESITSKMQTFTWIGLFVGSILGGLLYTIWFRSPYIAQALVTFTAALFAFKLYEPQIDTKKYKITEFITQNTQGFKELFQNIRTTQLTLIFITIGAGYQIAAAILGISQAKEYGIVPQIVGILFAGGYIVSAIASHFYPKMKILLGSKRLLFISTVILISTFLFAKYVGVILGAGLIFLRIASSTTFRNNRSIIFNKLFSSKNRATALSTLNLLTNLPYAILAYFMGAYIDQNSPNSFAFILGIVIAGMIIICLLVFKIINQRRSNIVVNV